MTAWFTGVEAIQGATPEWAALPFAGATLLGEVWILVIAMTLAYWFTGRRDIAALFGVSLTALSLVLVLKAVFGLPVQQPVPQYPPNRSHRSLGRSTNVRRRQPRTVSRAVTLSGRQ
ncbi:hypothetical protein ACFQH2_01170 [Natronoarchaeum sp. GCM10025703]|uniref:hypothetical protein n=1 Tax=Natronoarchaeum sp. GCM10025703 TaxID=3252685 RepID=UPI0036155970